MGSEERPEDDARRILAGEVPDGTAPVSVPDNQAADTPRGRLRRLRVWGKSGETPVKPLEVLPSAPVAPPPYPLLTDVGLDASVLARVEELVEILRDPQRFADAGADTPIGVLLQGKSGNGKTLLAKAIANEAGRPFILKNGSEFVDTHVGVGANRVRAAFDEAKKKAPCVLIIDEMDSLVRHRGSNSDPGSNEYAQTTGQLLTELQELQHRSDIVVIGTTNLSGAIDSAVISRLGDPITIPDPNQETRRQILEIHTRNKKLRGIDLDQVAAETAGLSGRDLYNYLNRGAITAARNHRSEITPADLPETYGTATEPHQVKFADVVGIQPAMETAQSIVHQLRNPKVYKQAGARMPRGCLITGPPGTGKTLLARAVAGEADATFFHKAGSALLTSFQAGGSQTLRELFADAKAHAPCVVFIDEIDAIGGTRGQFGSHEDRENTLNQLLVEMDGFSQQPGVVLIAATNFPEKLDRALVQRFEHRINLTVPVLAERKEILKLHAANKKLAADVDLDNYARKTVGMAGRELENMLNLAALRAARAGRTEIRNEDMYQAYWATIVGPENRNIKMNRDTMYRTAIHEAGHAICALFMEGSDPVHDISVVPRGPALGVTLTVAEDDRHLRLYPELLAELVMAHGGRAAEIIWQGEDRVSTGPSGDLKHIDQLTERMVRDFGMGGLSPRARPSAAESRVPESEQSQREVIAAQECLTNETEALAAKILQEHRRLLEKVTQTLIEKEVLSGDEFLDLVEEVEGTRTPRPVDIPPALRLSTRRGGPQSATPSQRSPRTL